MIPLFSLEAQTEAIRAEAMAEIAKVVDSQRFVSGPAVEAFERKLADYLGCKEVVCVNSGTTALHAALIACGVGPGDDVLTVGHTFISTAWAISYVGARPVFCDVDPATMCIDPSELAKRLTVETKAIVPVHLYGQPARLGEIMDFAEARGLPVIEDASQAIGAKYEGSRVGAFGAVNATGFDPETNLGAWGAGGACMTDDADKARRIRRLRDHAQKRRDHHSELGFDWQMAGLQGAVLSVKLHHLDAWNARRWAIADRYLAAFEGLPGVRTLPRHPWSEPIWRVFPIFHRRRDDLRAALERRGVETGIHYPTPVHLQPAYGYLGVAKGSLPETERAAATEISLPMFAELTDGEVTQVIAAVEAAVTELS